LGSIDEARKFKLLFPCGLRDSHDRNKVIKTRDFGDGKLLKEVSMRGGGTPSGHYLLFPCESSVVVKSVWQLPLDVTE